jgi:hypothetical protein
MSRTDDIKLEDLLLDEQNPRLPTAVGRRQDQMIQYIARTTSITEIMSAIAENDYFPGEPLIVIPGTKGKYITVEGNRRLTALKLLQNPDLYPKGRKIAEIAAEAEYKPTIIPCVIFDDRNDVVNYLGYRHITGVKQWEPLAKARYIANYFEHHTEKDAEPQSRYIDVARGIGSQGPYIKRQLDGLAVYNLIESNSFYNIDGLDEENISFSLISTAIGYESVLKFCGEAEHLFVERGKLKILNVEYLARWMFEQDEDGGTVLGDSRNIQRLAIILENDDATNALKEGDTLEKAYGVSRGLSDDLSGVLAAAENLIARAVSMIALVNVNESHRSRIENISKQVRNLRFLVDEN